MGHLCCFSVFVVIVCLIVTSEERSLTKIEKNGYQGLVIAFSPTVNDEGRREDLIRKLKNVFIEASNILYKLTNSGTYFEEIVFLIPKSWGSDWLSEEIPSATLERYNDADVWVESKSVFGNSLYAVQAGRCGEEGLKIHLIEAFLNTRNATEQAEIFVHEWLKYRFGIFDEYGFPGDDRYPLYYGTPGNDVRVTSCTNVELKLSNSCDADVSTGRLKDPSCRPKILNQQEPISSSFMYSTKLRSFCGGSYNFNHDASSLTKHNLLCNERSVWSVLRDHNDFKDTNNGKFYLAQGSSSPQFRYVQERDLRLVLNIHRSEYMTKERKNLLNTVVHRFLKYSIPKTSMVGFVSYGSATQMIYSESLQPVDEAAGAFQLYQSLADKSVCIDCALMKSIEILEEQNSSAEGGTILLITIADLSNEDVANLSRIVMEKKVRVHVVLYPRTRGDELNLEHVVSETGGSIQFVPENLENTPELLYEALRSSVREDTFGMPEDNVLITQSFFKGSSWVNLNFSVDETIGRDLSLLYCTSDYDAFDEESLKLITPVKTYTVSDMRVFGNCKTISVQNAQVGKYAFSVERMSNKQEPLFIQVLAKEKNLYSAIIIRCWLNTENQTVNPEKRPVILYAEVRSGNYPVRNARVEATLLNPNGGQESFLLLDDGIGDPDITKDDGIYSTYIVEITLKGYYILTLSVNDNEGKAEILKGDGITERKCCGSFVESVGHRTGRFERLYTYGSFYVPVAVNTDIYPPNRISDFRLVGMNKAGEKSDWRMYIKFNFTAPGKDYNKGIASKYEVKYFTNRQNAVLNTENEGKELESWEKHQFPEPSEYGTKEQITIEMQYTKLMDLQPYEFFFFVISAQDENNNTGVLSNVIEVYLPLPPYPPVTEPDITNQSTDSSNENEQILIPSSKRLSASEIGMIVGIVCGALLLITVLIVGIIIFRRKSKPKKVVNYKMERKDSKNRSNEYLEEITTKRELGDSNFSPIQSWSADVLMDHYEKVQEAKLKNEPPPIMKAQDILNSSTDSSQSLHPNPLYEANLSYKPPSAPLSTSSLNRSQRNISEV